jgi:transcriptional regulator with XRE-family HTH domain
MPKNVKSVLKDLGIGRKIKELRQVKGITIQELCNRTGLSKGLISQVENEQVSPPISTLLKIASALKTDLAHFFQDNELNKNIVVVRKDERVKSGRRGIKGIELGYTYESLAHTKINKHMEPFLVTFEPKEKDEIVMFNHDGEEFVFVLNGELEFITDEGDDIILKEGDSLYFESSISHGFRAVNCESSLALVVVFNKI